jgi:hypothetical protein
VEFRDVHYDLADVPRRPGAFVVFRGVAAIGILQTGETGNVSAVGPDASLELLQVVARLASD